MQKMLLACCIAMKQAMGGLCAYPEHSASSRTMLMSDCCAVMMLSSSSMLGLPSFHRSFKDWTATSRVPSSFSSSVYCSAPAVAMA